MRRKLICIFFILVGIATIAMTILFSRVGTPFYDAIIFLSVMTILAAAWFFSNELKKGTVFLWVFRIVIVLAVLAGFIFFVIALFPENPFYSLIILFAGVSIAALMIATWHNESEPVMPVVSDRGTVLLWVFRAAGILVILADLAFIAIIWFLTGKYGEDPFQNVLLLLLLAIAGIAAAALSLKLRAPVSGRGKGRAARCIPLVAALAITIALGSVYLNYMPKYTIEEGLNIVLSDTEFAQKDIRGGAYETVPRFLLEDGLYGDDPYYTDLFGGNPYYNYLYSYQCDSCAYDADGLHMLKGFILFNPATGEYEYTHAEEQDKTYSPGDWPEFFWTLFFDEYRQHNSVLNLYYREWWHPEASEKDQWVLVDSSDWDANIKEVIVPHSFPEDEARAFLSSKGEETLKAKLLEQISLLGPEVYQDKTIEVFFFGIHVATYQNGEIVLKP